MERTVGVLAIAATLVMVGCTTEGTLLPGSSQGANDGTGGTGVGGAGFGAGNSTGNTDCPDCVEDDTGVGTDNPFDPEHNPSSGVGLDDDGALVLDKSKTDMPSIIWIANTNHSTVTKVDTETFQILGRYATGSVDPSRTSVNSLGDVFVGNRSGQTLTKISAAGASCPDTNNDAQITTSTGFNDVLAYGQDDCVLWNVPVPDAPTVRGVAAQDVLVPDPQPDFPDKTKLEHYVWAGGTSYQKVYKFDGDDGTVLINTSAPCSVYGLALDGGGQLWISGAMEGGVIGRIDTNKCHDQNSCDAAEICTRDCSSGVCSCTSCSGDCDDAIKERLLMPSSLYGITVDFKQRVWMAGTGIKRYNPNAPIGQRYDAVPGSSFNHGIAADADGWVWGAAGGSGVTRVNADTLAMEMVPVPNAKGMAVDKDGKVWAIAYGAEAHVVTPGNTNTISDYATTPSAVTGLGTCYTYSDMTGLQLALATNEPGFYRETFEGCPQGTEWYQLDWNVETPTGTQVRFAARSAATTETLANAPWISIAKIPPDDPPASIAAAFNAAGQEMFKFLEVEVSLEGSITLNGLVSPRVLSFGVSHHCPPVAN